MNSVCVPTESIAKELSAWIDVLHSSTSSKNVVFKNSSLLNHQTKDVWEHLIRHVQPREEVWRIKKNLEIKNASMSKKKTHLKKSVDSMKAEIKLLEEANASLKQEIHGKQQKIIGRDSDLHSDSAKNLAFSRDVNFLKIHRSECAGLAKRVENLKNCILVAQQRIVPRCDDREKLAGLTAELNTLIEEYQCVWSEDPRLTGENPDLLKKKLVHLVESYPHSAIAESFHSLAKEQLREVENYQRCLREQLRNHSATDSMKRFEQDLNQLTTKVIGLWTTVIDLEQKVVPGFRYKRSNLRDELSEKMKDKLVVDESICDEYVQVGGQLAAARGLVEYLSSEMVDRSSEFENSKSTSESVEELGARIEKVDQDMVSVGAQLFYFIRLTSHQMDELSTTKVDIPKIGDLCEPSALRASLVSEVQKTIAAFGELDKHEHRKQAKCTVEVSLPVFKVLAEKRIIDMLMGMKNFQDFLRSSRISFDAKKSLVSRHEGSLYEIKGKLKKISNLRESTAQSLVPRLEIQLEKIESEKKNLKHCETAISNWMQEPAKDAILPQRTVDDLTFREWKIKLKL